VPAASVDVVSGGTACSKYSLPTCKQVQSSAIKCNQVLNAALQSEAIEGYKPSEPNLGAIKRNHLEPNLGAIKRNHLEPNLGAIQCNQSQSP
jgi:hypothetical protein